MRSRATVAVVMWLSVAGAATAADPVRSPSTSPAAEGGSTTLARFPSTLFTRTQLFFGSLTPDRSMVSADGGGELVGF